MVSASNLRNLNGENEPISDNGLHYIIVYEGFMRLCVLRPAPGRVCTRPPARRREAGMSRCGCRISIYDNYKFFLLNAGRTESSITLELQPTARIVSRCGVMFV